MKLKNMFYAPIIIALAALAGCDNDDSGKKPFDFSQFGPLVQNIAECTCLSCINAGNRPLPGSESSEPDGKLKC